MVMPIPDEMTAIDLPEFGGPEVLTPKTVAVPPPAEGEILIKVHAAGVNRPDVLQRKGGYSPPPGVSPFPGLEVAGEICATGTGVDGWHIGDKVCALIAGGGYSEYCTVPAEQVLPLPAGFSMIEGAALPETAFTVWANVFDTGGLKAGERLLVHGGSSGIGTMTIMMAREWGAEVYTTAGSDEKCAFCEELGATAAINYKTQDFVEAVNGLTEKTGIDLVLDMVGGSYIPRNISLLRADGRHISIAFLEGVKAEVNFLPLLLKRVVLTGSTLRARSAEEKGRLASGLKHAFWPAFEAGKIKPVIDSTFSLPDAVEAHRRMESSLHIGKIVLIP